MGNERPETATSQGNDGNGAPKGGKKYGSGKGDYVFDKGRGWKSGRFTGRCEGLQGHVYDCTDARSAAELYTTTTKEIAEYVGTKSVRGADARIAIESGRMPTFLEP